MVGAFLRRRDRTVRSLRVEHYSSAVNSCAGHGHGEGPAPATGVDGPIFVDSRSLEDSVAKMLSGETDYTLMDDLVVQYLVSNHAEEARTRLAFGSTPLLTRSLHLAIQRSLPDAESIISRFNFVLSFLMADRSYHRLLHLDWIHADVDGDGLVEFVPDDDRIGPRPPERTYELFATSTPLVEPRHGGAILYRWRYLQRLVRSAGPIHGLRLRKTRTGI